MELSRKEYVSTEGEKFNKKYEIDQIDEFSLKTLFNLQYDFMRTPAEHVKNRAEILKMIEMIKSNLKLKPTQEEVKSESKFKIGIICSVEAQSNEMYRHLSTSLKDVTKGINTNTQKEIQTKTSIYTILTKSSQLRGRRFHEYWNLTGDAQFEKDVLRYCVMR